MSRFTWHKTYRLAPSEPYPDRIFDTIEEAEADIGLGASDYLKCGRPTHAGYIIYTVDDRPTVVKVIKGCLDSSCLSRPMIDHIVNPQ